MTNNTIRTTGSGKVFQYASYSYGNTLRHYNAAPLTDLRFTYVPQSFTQDEPKKENFQCSPRDRLDIRIYEVSGKVKVEIKLLSWGNGVAIHDAIIAKTALGGYVLTFKSENKNFYTITLLGGTSYVNE